MSEDLANVSIVTGSTDRGFDTAGIALLLIRFGEAVDQRRPSEIAELFLPDGVFKPSDTPIQGQASIEAFYKARLHDPRRITRHLWSNLHVRPLGENEASLSAILMTYAFEPNVSELDLQLRIGNLSGRCKKDGQDGWRFAEHLYERTFTASLPLSKGSAPTSKV